MRKLSLLSSALAFVLLLAGSGSARAAEKANGKGHGSIDEKGLERLRERTGGRAQVSFSRATGAVRFVSIEPGEGGESADLMASSGRAEARAKSSAFLNEYAGVFGLRDARGADARPRPEGRGRRPPPELLPGLPRRAGVRRSAPDALRRGRRPDRGQRDRDPRHRSRREPVAARHRRFGGGDQRRPRRQRRARGLRALRAPDDLPRGTRAGRSGDQPPRLADRGRQRRRHPRVRLRRRAFEQDRRPAPGHLRCAQPPRLRRGGRQPRRPTTRATRSGSRGSRFRPGSPKRTT